MLNGHSLNGSSRPMLSALKAAIRHGVLTMMALPDLHTQKRFQIRTSWVETPDDPGLAYAYTEAKAPQIIPSPRDISRAKGG